MRNAFRACAALAAMALPVALAACGPGPSAPPRPRLVVLYATCTLNRGYLSPFDESVPYTPNLQRLAGESRVFRRHVTEAGQSGLAFASILTGTQSDRHGIYHHPSKLASENVLMAEAFAAAGYDTWFWSGQPMAAASLDYGQGVVPAHTFERALPFSSEVQPLADDFLLRLTANDDEFDAILGHLREDPEYEAFVQVCFTATHEPYHQYATPEQVLAFGARFPEEGNGVTRAEIERFLPIYEGNRHELNFDFPATVARLRLTPADVERLAAVIEAFYKTSVHNLDRLLGLFLDRLEASGLLDETLLAFTVDHGESMYRENALFHWTHGLQLAPEVLDVPLMIRGPRFGVAPGSFEAVTRSIDVFPTLAGLCGLAAPDVDGVDLAPALRGEVEAPRLLAYSHTTTWGEQRVRRFRRLSLLHGILPRADPALMWTRIRDGDLVFKLSRSTDGSFVVQAFDLARDPAETTDLFDPENPDHALMQERLAAYKARLVQRYDPSSGLTEDEALERLRELGYL